MRRGCTRAPRFCCCRTAAASSRRWQLGAPNSRSGLASPPPGCARPAPFQLLLAGEGETTLGPLTPAAQGFPRGWEGLEHPLHYTADIDRALWCKLAINGVINPLTALENCSNGALLEPRHGPILESLCAEIEAIARAAGHPLFAQPLIHQVKQVAASTAANRSSMLEDISAGRPTEIDQITGYLCRVADARGVAAPLNRQLLQEIHRLEGTHSPQPEEHP